MSMTNFVRNVRQSYKEDGAWSWLLCFCACLANAIVMGIDYSFGEPFGSIMKDFNATEDSVAWIHSVQVSVHTFSAALSSMLAEKLGFSVLIAIGTLVFTVSMAISVISNSVSVLILFYGVFGGFSLGLIYTPCNIICSFHFIKWRSLATGVAICGSGIGIIIISEAMNFIIPSYGWKGCMILCACITPLNTLMAGVAYILPEHYDVLTAEEDEENINSLDETVEGAK